MSDKEREVIREVLNLMGGPTMTYSPKNEVVEWRARWEMAGDKLMRLLGQCNHDSPYCHQTGECSRERKWKRRIKK